MNEIREEERSELAYLRSTRAIRERTALLYRWVLEGGSKHFVVDESKLDAAARFVLDVIRRAYPTLDIPYHSRWRHFGQDDGPRMQRFSSTVRAMDSIERGRCSFDLAIVSVLLDAGAGAAWRYDGIGRSEGLAAASFDLLASGALAGERGRVFTADGAALRRVDEELLRGAFRVSAENPLEGLAGRASLLRSVGEQIAREPAWFCGTDRPGGLFDQLLSRADGGMLRAGVILEVLLGALSAIWPGRETLAGENVGDAWPHRHVREACGGSGLVPFHKLSQWLAYSLVEPLEAHGLAVIGLDELTALAEYRNGGLLIDTGVIELRDPSASARAHAPGDELVVEWRALTVQLLDMLAVLVRRELGMTAEELPLAKVLQGGTWTAGREIAAAKRPGGAPPLSIASDGTVF